MWTVPDRRLGAYRPVPNAAPITVAAPAPLHRTSRTAHPHPHHRSRSAESSSGALSYARACAVRVRTHKPTRRAVGAISAAARGS